MKSITRISIWTIWLLILVAVANGQTTLDSTYVHVNIGNYGAALFGFGPKSSPLIGSTAVSVGCGSDGNGLYTVYTNYGTPTMQTSARIPLTCTITTSSDPDGDSNQLASVVVTSAQSGTVGGQTVKLNSASYQSERIGGHSQNETIGGAAQLTIGTNSARAIPFYPCGKEHKKCSGLS